MPATLETPKVAAETGELTKNQKLAALLVMLGSESAAVILNQFQPREIEAISYEMTRFNLITREQQQEILMEFSKVAAAVRHETAVPGQVKMRPGEAAPLRTIDGDRKLETEGKIKLDPSNSNKSEYEMV